MCAAAHAQVGTHARPSPLLAAPLFLQQMADMLISEEAKESPPSLFITYASADSDGQSGLSRTETRPRSCLCCQSCGVRLGIHGNQRRQLITESFSSSCPLFLLLHNRRKVCFWGAMSDSARILQRKHIRKPKIRQSCSSNQLEPPQGRHLVDVHQKPGISGELEASAAQQRWQRSCGSSGACPGSSGACPWL